eukprot:TRINITY_DN8915_c0_g1_i2.p1 TRINITY_DN8915_c0_g1~~TRINITY_DN8915_c0_g1_i2.p1  ORF type:complete len:344 (-),score=50.24 TRINITY_DN8915_c0_g1_i2:228-1259(-)
MLKGYNKDFLPDKPVICITKSSLRRLPLPAKQNKSPCALRAGGVRLAKKRLKKSMAGCYPYRKLSVHKCRKPLRKRVRKLTPPAVGLDNIGTNCYANSGVQCILCVPELNAYFLTERFAKDLQSSESINFCRAIAEVYRSIFTSSEAANVSSKPMTDLCPLGQNDTHEFFTKSLFPRLGEEVQFIPNSSAHKKGIIESVFGGVLANKTVCKTCFKESVKHDAFLDLSLAISGNSLEECLDQYFLEEELKDIYFCERCNSLQSAVRGVRMHQCPKYLILHLKRLLPERKITKVIKYPVELALTKFTSSRAEYELQAVCVHTGSGAGGHFLTFAKRAAQVLYSHW